MYACFIIWRGKKKPWTNSYGSSSMASSLRSASSKDPWIFSPPIQEPGTPSSSCSSKAPPCWLLVTFPSGNQGLWFWGIVMCLPSKRDASRSFSILQSPSLLCLAAVAIAVTGLHHQQLHQEDAQVFHFQIAILWSYYAKPTICNINSNLCV